MRRHASGKMLVGFIIALASAPIPVLFRPVRGDEVADREYYRNRAILESDEVIVCYRPGGYRAARGACVAWKLHVIRVDRLGDYLVCRWRPNDWVRRLQVVAALDRHPDIQLVQPVERPWLGFPDRPTLPPL